MVSNHAISATRVPGMQQMLGMEETPETGAFDFFNYLLGLQVGSDNGQKEGDVLGSILGAKTDKPLEEDPLLQIFQKKEEPVWNPMFPVAGQTQAPEVSLVQKTDTKTLGQAEFNPESKTSVLNPEGDQRYSSKTENAFVSPADFLNLQKLIDKNGADAESANGVMEDSKSKAGQMNSMIQKYTSNTSEDKNKQPVQSYSQLARAVEKQTEPGSVNNTQSMQQAASQIESEESTSKSHESRGKQKGDSLFALNISGMQEKNASQVDNANAEINVKETPKQSLPEVFKKVESMVHNGGGKMTVELTPPDLGRVEIQVITRGKNVEIKMKSENEFAKVALESHVSDLKSSMQGNDLQLHKVEVTMSKDWDKAQMGGMFSSFQGQHQQQSGFHGFSRENSRDSGSRNFDVNFNSSGSRGQVLPTTAGTARSFSGSGRVDIRI